MIKSTLYACHLRSVALLGSSTRRIGIHLRSCSVWCIGHASTKAQALLVRNGNDSLLRDGLTDHFAIGIGRGNMCYLLHRLNHRCEPFRRRTGLILHQVKPVGNFAHAIITNNSISRRFRRSEFRIISVGRLMQIQMTGPVLDMAHIFPQKPNQRRRLIRRGFRVERSSFDDLAIGIKRSIRIGTTGRPSLDPLISPRTDARGQHEIEVLRVVRRSSARQE
mmetsp:Transcript_890/g.1840  ORF Transcript_890/g.1840 Transcript_890/m.1840 type:complete len:221 (-) Transcript_890:512-1174(-)